MNFAVKAGANVGSFSNLPKIPIIIFKEKLEFLVKSLTFRIKKFNYNVNFLNHSACLHFNNFN